VGNIRQYRLTNLDSPVSTFFLGDFSPITSSATCNFSPRLNVDVVEGKSSGKITTPEDNTSDSLQVSIENAPDPLQHPSTAIMKIEICTPHPLRGKITGRTGFDFLRRNLNLHSIDQYV